MEIDNSDTGTERELLFFIWINKVIKVSRERGTEMRFWRKTVY